MPDSKVKICKCNLSCCFLEYICNDLPKKLGFVLSFAVCLDYKKNWFRLRFTITCSRHTQGDWHSFLAEPVETLTCVTSVTYIHTYNSDSKVSYPAYHHQTSLLATIIKPNAYITVDKEAEEVSYVSTWYFWLQSYNQLQNLTFDRPYML